MMYEISKTHKIVFFIISVVLVIALVSLVTGQGTKTGNKDSGTTTPNTQTRDWAERKFTYTYKKPRGGHGADTIQVNIAGEEMTLQDAIIQGKLGGQDNDWAISGDNVFKQTGNVGVGTNNPSAKLEVAGGLIKATGGLVVETRTSDPVSPVEGQIWLRTDLS